MKGKEDGIIVINENLVVIEVDGNIIACPGEEWRLVAYQYFIKNLEPGIVHLFQKKIQPGMTFIDVGANIGFYSLLAARIIGEVGRVLSFEPTPRIFSILKNNIQANGYLENQRIIPYQMAVTNGISDNVRLFVYPDNLTRNSMYSHESEGFEEIIVPCSSLDSLLSDYESINVVKIDAEGAEPIILEGMKRVIMNNPQIIIIIEFVPSFILNSGRLIEDFIEQINLLDLTYLKIDDYSGELSEIDLAELKKSVSLNLLLRHKDIGDVA